LERTVADIGAKRALYIDNVMFIVGERAIVSLDINGWNELDRLKMKTNPNLIIKPYQKTSI
ncbi:MAG: hypothetical protein Q7R33_06825, partial [Nitrosarchaeum sp.]|nr:hypothetical protein [Nitrosarchaeum sp.]